MAGNFSTGGFNRSCGIVESSAMGAYTTYRMRLGVAVAGELMDSDPTVAVFEMGLGCCGSWSRWGW